MTVAETEPTAVRRNIEAELEIIRASKGSAIMVRENAAADQQSAPPQFDALITAVDNHRILPYIHYRTLLGDEGVFAFDVNTVAFNWQTPRVLEITDPYNGSIVLYTQA